jgi:SAM-dependent methyltransferase
MENIENIRNYWYSYIYDRQENQTDDVEYLLSILGQKPKEILEVCCGSGRISIPLAKAGHNVTGFDMDDNMLEVLSRKSIGINNLSIYKADALDIEWGKNFDVIVLAGNIMINIETNGDYKDSQRQFIKKANKALKQYGYLYLDFDLHNDPEKIFNNKTERTIFEGYDDKGVYGKCIIWDGEYNKETQICKGKNRIEITLTNGEKHIINGYSKKHIPTLEDIKEWLNENNFNIEQMYGNYNRDPISENTHRGLIYAKNIKSANCV